jgi:hypothetical protein
MEMKHQLVLVEGRIYPNGMIIEHGAVQVPDEPVPVTWNFQFDKTLLGKASNWTRDPDTGECWMDLDLDTPLTREDLDMMDVNVFLVNVLAEERKVVDSGILKAVAFTLPIPGGWHRDVEKEVKDADEETNAP